MNIEFGVFWVYFSVVFSILVTRLGRALLLLHEDVGDILEVSDTKLVGN